MGNLVSEGRPYVHSNSENFVGITTLARGKEDSKIDAIIAQLESIEEQLRARAIQFCGGRVTKQRLEEIFGGNLGEDYVKLIKIMKEVMLSVKMKQLLTKRNEYDFKKLQEILSKKTIKKINISDIANNTVTDKVVIKAILDTVNFGDEIKINLKDQKIKMKQAFTKEGKNKVENIYTSHLYKTHGKKMKERIREMVKDAQKEIQSNTVFLEEFKKMVLQQAQLEKIDMTIPSNKNLLNSTIQQLEQKMKVLEAAQASGQMTEQGVGIILNQAENEIYIEIIGDISEKEVQNILEQLNGSINKTTSLTGVNKDQKKQSYSDWLMTRNGVTVRVQVKNYRSAIETFLHNRKNGGDPFGGAYIHLFSEDTPYDEFMKNLNTSNQLQGVNKEDLDYVIANDFWFRKKESYGHNQSLGKNYTSQRANMELFMSSAFMNYLGIVVGDNTVVNCDMSNIFYYIMGDGFVPTYLIIRNAISYFKTMKNEMTRLHLKISATVPSISAKDFYNAKLNQAEIILGIKGSKGKARYQDPHIIKTGQDMGAEILNSTIISGLNLQVDARKLYQSGFTFM